MTPALQTRSPAARLYLVVPGADDASELARTLDHALETAAIAAVLLHLPDGGERTQIDYIKAITPAVQEKDIALLLDGHADLVARAGADGAHLNGIEALTDALTTLKPDRITGGGGLRTRHDAMLAAERGADYVMFGDPDGRRPAFDQIVERVAWWAELFEIPCVAWAESLDEVAPLAGAGADFVALGPFVFADLAAASTIIRAATERLAQAPARSGP